MKGTVLNPFCLLVYDYYFGPDDFRLFYLEYAIKIAYHYTCVLCYLPSHAYTKWWQRK